MCNIDEVVVKSPRFRKIPIPEKANYVLNILLFIFALLSLRVWHLSVVQYEERVKMASRPRERVIFEPAPRASITDRFGLSLAKNRVGYQAAIVYQEITEIPSTRWVADADGKKVKTHPRKEHIAALAELLGKELYLDPRRVEDEIHAKAALYYQRPYVLLEGISEQQYSRLRMLQRDWPGLHPRMVPYREYPYGRVASHVIGYLGPINRQEYEGIASEITLLQSLVEDSMTTDVLLPEKFSSIDEVKARLQELKDLAYSVRDHVGKSGIEAQFEEELKGFRGHRRYYADAKGNFLRELPGAKLPTEGRSVQLSISLELQKVAEELLIESEKIRDGRSTFRDRVTGHRMPQRQPWVKGGAIVVLDPHTGQVLTLASYPRFDPNDFVAEPRKTGEILRWLEADSYLAAIWDGRLFEKKEVIENCIVEDLQRGLGLPEYLSSILPKDHICRKKIEEEISLQQALQVQEKMLVLQKECNDQWVSLQEALDFLCHQGQKKIESVFLQKELPHCLSGFSSSYDQVLFIDLLRLFADRQAFSDEVVDLVDGISLEQWRRFSMNYFVVDQALEKMMKELFHEIDWQEWVTLFGKKFLREKRREEKEAGVYAKPYLDLYDKQEKLLFQQFWQEKKWDVLQAFLGLEENKKDDDPYLKYVRVWNQELCQGAHRALEWVQPFHNMKRVLSVFTPDIAVQLMKACRRFSDLSAPVWGNYRSVRKGKEGTVTLKELASAFYPRYGYGSMRSVAYRHYCTQGSVFKIVTAYEAMRQRLGKLGGYATPQELSPFRYHDQLFRENGHWNVGRWESGEPIPRMYKGGVLPRSYRDMGDVDLIEALAHSANPYFAILALDYLEKPTDLTDAASRFGYGKKTGIALPGEVSGRVPSDLEENITGLFSLTMGQHTLVNTPLQTAVMLASIANGGILFQPEILYKQAKVQGAVDLPEAMQKCLFEALKKATDRSRSANGGSLAYVYRNHQSLLQQFLDSEGELIGKSSTSEQIEVVGLDREMGTSMYNHTWFGGIAFEKSNKQSFLSRTDSGRPELIVVVYLPFGGYGKEASPIAAAVVNKWREIQSKHVVESNTLL